MDVLERIFYKIQCFSNRHLRSANCIFLEINDYIMLHAYAEYKFVGTHDVTTNLMWEYKYLGWLHQIETYGSIAGLKILSLHSEITSVGRLNHD